jgi:uncharacterized repeat protein (TIGR03803 family)
MSRQTPRLHCANRLILNFAIARGRAAALVLSLALTIILTPLAWGQSFQLIHRFTNGDDGGEPRAGLTMDGAGRLYGTTTFGGAHNFGTVFRLTRAGSGWVLNTLYSFQGGTDGAYPQARVIFGPDGTLYGTTAVGGSPNCDPPENCGTVFNLQPPASACKTTLCPWTKTIIHNFVGTLGGNDGEDPLGDLTFDQAGNLYGTASEGGQYGDGMIYKLSKANGSWTESILYSFTIFQTTPMAGVTLDASGNLYGTVPLAYGYYGAVYELTPSGGGWTFQVIHNFQQSDGSTPYAGLILDSAGNLYGATTAGGANNGGTAFELSPSNGSWAFSVLYNFGGSNYYAPGPQANLAFDQSGNLYGTTYAEGANDLGSIFKLTPAAGQWTYTSLYDFSEQYVAAYPISNVIFDASGNLYGTTSDGGTPYNCGESCGVVWEISGQ